MASSGPRNPTTTASDTSVGTVAWGTPANAVSSNDTRTTAALNNTTSEYLKVTNFGFTIPTNAVITGVMVEVEKSRTAGTGTLADSSVRLVRKGTIIGINHSSQGTAWTGTDAYSTYGGDGDLWGVPWVAAEINAFDFGVVFSAVETASLAATAGVDHVRVTVYYTEGYVSAPQVQDRNEVLLFGQYYPLASPEIQIGLATAFPPKVVTNSDYGRSSNPILSTYAVDDLRGGGGLWKYTDYTEDGRIHPSQATRFWTSQTADTLWAHAITLGPLSTSIGYGTGVTALQLNAVNVLSNTLTFGIGNRIFTHDGTDWSAQIDALPNAIIDSVVFNSRIFYAQGSSGYSYQTAPGSAAVDVATPTFMFFTVWDNKIYGIDSSGVLYSSTSGDSASWTTLATLPIPYLNPTTNYAYQDLNIYDDADGSPIIWALTAEGPYMYDAVNNKWFRSRFQFPYYYRNTGDFRGFGAVYNGSLFVRAQDLRIYKLTMTGSHLEVEDVSIDRPDGVPTEYQGSLTKFVADNDLLFTQSMDSVSNASADHCLWAYNGNGWHNLFRAAASDIASMWIAAVVNTSVLGYRLYFAGRTAAGGYFVQYISLSELAASPLTGTKNYASSGFVELPWYDGGTPEQRKTATTFRMKIAGASSTETVQVAYRINGSTGSYTNLGSAVGVTEEVSIPFGTNNVGLAFRSIQIRLTFARGGTTTNAPKVEYVAVDFIRNPEVLRSYVCTIDLSDLYKGRTPGQMADDIRAHMFADVLGTFAWRDDADNVRSSLVKMLRFDGVDRSGYDQTGTYKITLVEVGYN